MEKETLKEAAERFYQKGLKDDLGLSFHDGVSIGAKWQQERMYSEEEVYNILVEHTIELFKCQPCTLNEFFEQFKKK